MREGHRDMYTDSHSLYLLSFCHYIERWETTGAIPKHCFERSALRSFSYLFADFAMVSVLTFAATYIDILFNFKNGSLLDGYTGAVVRVLAWAGFALCTGTIGFGIWVIGHECEWYFL